MLARPFNQANGAPLAIHVEKIHLFLRLAILALLCDATMTGRLARAQEPAPADQAASLATPFQGPAPNSRDALKVQEDLQRGEVHLKSPISAPQDRGPLLIDPFPTYSPTSDYSDWGVGWRSSLSIVRQRTRGDVIYSR